MGVFIPQLPPSFIKDHVESGVVITADSAGVNKNYSISAGTVWIGGNKLSVAAVSAVTVGASKDRYIDLRNNGDGTATYITNEVANNAASQALTAGDLRVGIVVAGVTTIADAGSINQGEETKVLPIASSVPYQVTDSLGNLICPRDPNSKLLGQRKRITDFASGTTADTAITGLLVPVIIPTGRKIKADGFTAAVTGSTGVAIMSLYNGTTTGGTKIAQGNCTTTNGFITARSPAVTIAAGAQSFIASISSTAGNPTVGGASTGPSFVRIELE